MLIGTVHFYTLDVMTMVTVTTALYESKTVTAVSTNNQDISLTSTSKFFNALMQRVL